MKTEERWLMFGREAIKYDHVGSPRFRYQDFWGAEEFEEEAACAEACKRHFLANFPNFLILYPRKRSERDELQGVVNAEFRV